MSSSEQVRAPGKKGGVLVGRHSRHGTAGIDTSGLVRAAVGTDPAPPSCAIPGGCVLRPIESVCRLDCRRPYVGTDGVRGGLVSLLITLGLVTWSVSPPRGRLDRAGRKLVDVAVAVFYLAAVMYSTTFVPGELRWYLARVVSIMVTLAGAGLIALGLAELVAGRELVGRP